jgi:soluble lytic murein transglycosylase
MMMWRGRHKCPRHIIISSRSIPLLAVLTAALFAQSHAPAPAKLAVGIAAYERKDYAGAIAALQGLDVRLPKLSDYAAYYLAAARIDSKTQNDVTADLAPVWSAAVASPLAGRAALVAANGLVAAEKPADAARILLQHYDALPQPDGDAALALAYQSAGDYAHAALSYQQVYYRYPASDAADQASPALTGLRDKLGAAYPAISYQTALDRAGKLMEARNYARARTEYQGLIVLLDRAERDLARVGVGAADFLRGQTTAACQYLRTLEVSESEADAERLYYLAECAGRSNNETERLEAIHHLDQQHERSPWRFKALTSLADRYLLTNRMDDYEPLYAAAGKSFPAEPHAAAAHWRYVWAGYIRRNPNAADRLREHLMLFAAQSTAASALYYLGRLDEDARDYGSARVYFEKLVSQFPNYYYGLLGSKRLTGAVAPAAPSARTAEFLRTLGFSENHYAAKMEPSMETKLRVERAQLLRSAGLADLAAAELRFGARIASPPSSQPALLAIEMARAADSAFLGLRAMKAFVPDGLSVPLTGSTGEYWQYLFPLPFKDDLVRNAKAQSLDPSVVAALIRQESEFNPRALSRAKAYGLTQVRPMTGRTLARKAGMRTFSAGMLYQPATNLRLGTIYLRELLDDFDGRWEETLAAYNAGKSRAVRWRTWGEWREPAEFVESIPFTETHDYVQAVMRNAELYKKIYGDRIQ